MKVQTPRWKAIRALIYLYTLFSSHNHFPATFFFFFSVNNVSSPWSSQSPWKHSDPVLMMFPWVRSHHTPFWTFYFYLYYVLYHIYYLVFYQLYVSLIYLDLLLEVKGQCLVQHCTFHNSWYDVQYVIIMLIRFMLLITFFWLVE